MSMHGGATPVGFLITPPWRRVAAKELVIITFPKDVPVAAEGCEAGNPAFQPG